MYRPTLSLGAQMYVHVSTVSYNGLALWSFPQWRACVFGLECVEQVLMSMVSILLVFNFFYINPLKHLGGCADKSGIKKVQVHHFLECGCGDYGVCNFYAEV
jgi:hypothetical protein